MDKYVLLNTSHRRPSQTESLVEIFRQPFTQSRNERLSRGTAIDSVTKWLQGYPSVVRILRQLGWLLSTDKNGDSNFRTPNFKFPNFRKALVVHPASRSYYRLPIAVDFTRSHPDHSQNSNNELDQYPQRELLSSRHQGRVLSLYY